MRKKLDGYEDGLKSLSKNIDRTDEKALISDSPTQNSEAHEIERFR